MKYSSIVLAAGSGSRTKLAYNKVLYPIDGETRIIDLALQPFIDDQDCVEIILVCNEDLAVNHSKIRYVEGGSLRMDSVYNGLQLVSSEYVMIHDGARPYLKKELLDDLKRCLQIHDACIVAVKAKDSIKQVVDDTIEKSLNREQIYLAQTPQCFKTDLLKQAYQQASGLVTDDSALVEQLGVAVKIVEGDYCNTKITFPEDLK